MFATMISLDVVLICMMLPCCLGYSHSRNDVNDWTTWSTCSVTCGQGMQSRVRDKSSVETRICFRKFCPSYMDWPRFHFSGNIVVDSSTLNNIRCNYNSRVFTTTDLSRFTTSEVAKQKIDILRYKNAQYNWNPMGSGHVYFLDTFLSSFCTAYNNCDSSTTITETVVRENDRAQMATPDPDKQSACEIWGLVVHMPGVLQANYRVSGSQQDGHRNAIPRSEAKGYAYGQVGRFKSKLENITWYSSHHQKLFKNVTSLSMTFVMDKYNQIARTGRLTGTIGPTSSDDPVEQTATRILKASGSSLLHAPIYLHSDKNVITLDLSGSVKSYFNGTLKAKNLWLAVTVNCRFPHIYQSKICSNVVTSTSGQTFYILENISLKYLDFMETWFKVLGGVVDVDVSHVPKAVARLLSNHRIAVLKSVRYTTYTTYKVHLQELKFGINIGVMGALVKRLNVRQSETYTPFVSKYGHPLVGADLQMVIAPDRATLDCNLNCSTILSEPKDALLIRNKHQHTNASGMNSFKLTAVKDPGYLRCGVDGQLYVFAVQLKYHVGGTIFTFTNTDSSHLPADFPVSTVRPLARIYNQITVKKCPGWLDIEDIFEQYYNLYPVMWRNGIIDMHSYEEVKQKARLLKTAMFETDFSHAKYMPASRDLSLSKQQLIWNWMECGMKFDTSRPKQDTCSASEIKTMKKKVQDLLLNAVIVEWATIPPYFTAWLSLKTEDARNLRIARVIKTIYTEEMLHMSLAANLLNAVGGTVNLTNMNHLPTYPTQLGSGAFYNLLSNILVPLERFSIGLVREVFTRIESPSSAKERKIYLEMAELWKLLSKPGEVATSPNMQMLLDEQAATGGESKTFPDIEHFSGAGGKLKMWKAINAFARKHMRPQSNIVTTIGGLYSKVLTHTAYLESCLQIKTLEGNIDGGTVFTGDVKKQLNMSQWYDPAQKYALKENVDMIQRQMKEETLVLSKSKSSFVVQEFKERKFPIKTNLTKPLFEVVDLKTAIQAVMEIVYQGEGGSACSAFRKSPIGEFLSFDNSHYAQFWEIVRGRELELVNLSSYANPPTCIDYTEFKCSPNDTISNQAHCFVGDEVPFDIDGVWPIIPNPGPHSYDKNTDAYVLDRQFNLQYTRLLWCLQDVFSGNKQIMKTCMSVMYDLIITGKKLVATPLKRSSTTYTDMRVSCQQCHAAPSWIFTRDLDYRAGLHLDT